MLLAYRQPEDGILSIADTCLVGTVCGIVLTPVMTPAEMVKVQLQFDVFEPRKYGGMISIEYSHFPLISHIFYIFYVYFVCILRDGRLL